MSPVVMCRQGPGGLGRFESSQFHSYQRQPEEEREPTGSESEERPALLE